VHRWRFLATFLRPVFAASRVQHVSDLHLKFALRPHHVFPAVWQTSNLQRLRLGEDRKKEERKKKSQGKNIMVCPIPYGDHNNCHVFGKDKHKVLLPTCWSKRPVTYKYCACWFNLILSMSSLKVKVIDRSKFTFTQWTCSFFRQWMHAIEMTYAVWTARRQHRKCTQHLHNLKRLIGTVLWWVHCAKVVGATSSEGF